MIEINDILALINTALSGHYFKDITFYKVAELKKQNSEDQIERPYVFQGDGNYSFVQDDTKGLIVYHRILDYTTEEDNDSGFGRNPMTVEKYLIRSVFYGNKSAINKSCEDLNLLLVKEFRSLLPRRIEGLIDSNSLKVTKNIINQKELSEDEGLTLTPENISFAIEFEFTLKTTRNCVDLSCDSEVVAPCKPATITDSDGVTEVEVPSGGNFSCTPCAPCEDATVENSDSSYQTTVASGGTLVLPDITFTDSDGTQSSVPSVKNITATPCVAPSGIAYDRPRASGANVIYVDYDDVWNVENRPYPDPPSNPLYIQRLDENVGIFNRYRFLKYDNIFASKDRFTDPIGGTDYSGQGAGIDHLTGIMNKYELYGGTFTEAITYAESLNSSVHLGYNNWRVANIMEVFAYWNGAQRFSSLDIVTNQPSAVNVASSTTRYDSTTVCHRVLYTTGISTVNKTSDSWFLIVRNHF
jgi:hypothetical protein